MTKKEILNTKSFEEIINAEATEEQYEAMAKKLSAEVLTAYQEGNITVAKKKEVEEGRDLTNLSDADAIGNYFLYALSVSINPAGNLDFWKTIAFEILSQGIDVNELQKYVAMGLYETLDLGDSFAVVLTYYKEGEDAFPATGIDPQAITGNYSNGIVANIALVLKEDIEEYSDVLSKTGTTLSLIK